MASTLPPIVEKLLDVARWAPSGDNAQPWTFRIDSGERITLHIHCAAGNVYEYAKGQPTLLSAGTLLENIEIAAPAFGRRASWRYLGCSNCVHAIEISLAQSGGDATLALFDEITRRSVDRRPFRMRPLSKDQKSALAAELSADIDLCWFESLADRRKIAGLTRLATEIRLRIPETFEIHNRIVDWDNLMSAHGIPARALGLDPLTLKIMRWTLARRARTEISNKLGSPTFASLQMDVLPGIFSAAYFAFVIRERAHEPDSRVVQVLKAGQSVQRFWLRATKLGLAMQPCLAPLAFDHYGRTGENFTSHLPSLKAAANLARRLDQTIGTAGDAVFLGRIGWPRGPQTSRSVRRPVVELLDPGSSASPRLRGNHGLM